MKKFILLLVILIPVASFARNIQAVFSYSRFNSNPSPYIETYLSVAGKSVQYVKNKNQKWQAAIKIVISIKNETGVSFYKDAYNLLSPEVIDTNKIAFNFLDQHRIPLGNGNFIMEIVISDINSELKELKINQNIVIDFPVSRITVSDILLIDSYSKTETENQLSKSGYDLVPFVDNFYPKEINELKFYVEIYNASLVLGTSSYLLTYQLETAESHQIVEGFKSFKKVVSQEVTPLMSEFDISNLPSGNYKLVVELRDKENNLLAFQDLFVQRSNFKKETALTGKLENINITNTWVTKYTNRDTLMDYVASLRPIANANELTWQDNQLKMADIKLMQQFLFDFWQRQNPTDPEGEWLKYLAQVKLVQKAYGTRLTKGYSTDRGRVYLQYGAPNTITENVNEPDAYPYEIWHYYKIKDYTNKKFLFYSPDLIASEFRLLHSNMPGELIDTSWQMKIYKRNTQSNNMDVEKRNQNFGNKVEDLFNQPK